MIDPSKVKAVRERLGESQESFARRFGVNQSTVQRWETRGLPNSGTARIAVEQLMTRLAIEKLVRSSA